MWVVRRAVPLIVVLCLASIAQAASMPPRYRFRTFEQGSVRVHFHLEVEASARKVMALVLEILPRLQTRYRVAVPTLDIVVHDVSDSPNGLATVFPYPAVEIRTASVDGAESGPTESWLRMVVTHELTHIVHLEQAGGIYGFGRKVFGRAPFLFPNALQPAWFIEGLAVHEETHGTAYGRGRHTFTKMVVDEAARSGRLSRLDQATLGLDLWPLGNAAYLYGEEFLAYVDTRMGEGRTRDLALFHGSHLRPYLDSRTFRAVTGTPLGALWNDFARNRSASLATLKPARMLTKRGTVQSSPRLSPDGTTLAYTSATLDRLRQIRLMDADGGHDRRLATRLSGSALSWSRDGSFLVFDETNQVRKFESRSDLHRVDVRSGRRTRLTHGLRASDPDVGPGGPQDAAIVFVRRFPDRSELSLRGADGSIRELTRSTAGTEWSHPRFSPSGDAVVAARMAKGALDLVIVDAVTGAVREITHDRALDADPSWIGDRTIIFRSDREDQEFRFFLIDRSGDHLRRVADSPDNAFMPEVDPERKTIYYSRYSADGYDLAAAPFGEGGAPTPFEDVLPKAAEDPVPYNGPAHGYRQGRTLAPRFVTPFVELVSDEWRVGLATAAFDPLLRTAWGAAGSWGTRVARGNGLAYLRYDRFTPTFTALARFESSPASGGVEDLREARVSVDIPLERAVLRNQTLDITARRRKETLDPAVLDTGVLAASWVLDSTRSYPMSISSQDGVRLRVSATRELKALGSDLDFGKAIVDARVYASIGPTVLAARAGYGTTFGPRIPRAAYTVGGLSSSALLDPVGDEPAVLRGFEAASLSDPSRFGRKIAFANLEWRVPIAHPQRGLGALPFFVRHLHLSAGVDAAAVAPDRIDIGDARVGASIGLGADLFLGHRIPISIAGGLGFGLNRDGRTVPWFSVGLPF